MTQAMEGLERVHKEETVQRAENLEREDFVCLLTQNASSKKLLWTWTTIRRLMTQ